MHKISSKLDWNRMLGFEQITEARTKTAKLSPKVGVKLGAKAGVKA